MMLKKILPFFFLFTVAAFCEASGLQFVVKPYIQNTTVNSVMVLWETNILCTGEVKYGKAEFNRSQPVLNKKELQLKPETMHVIELKNLEPGTQYFYQVVAYNDSDTLAYEIPVVTTFPEKEQPFAFAVFGDSQRSDDTLVWNKISSLALMERPNFGIVVGDLVDKGRKNSDWRNDFLGKGNGFMKTIPLFPVMGNHDGNHPNYFKYMKSRSEKSYYTFSYGNAQFFILDDNLDIGPGSQQYEWLQEELAKSTAVWKMAFQHHPPYSSDNDDFGDTRFSLKLKGDPALLPVISLFEKFDLDISFFGHIHSYERTWPIINDTINDNGVVYIQTGGAGGGLETSAIMRSWFTAKLKRDHHFCMVTISKNKLNLTAIDYNGNVFDQLSLEKKITAFVSPPVFITAGDKFMHNMTVTIKDFNKSSEIRYTTDNSEPASSSLLYTAPFSINNSATIKAAVFNKSGKSETSIINLTKTDGLKPIDIQPAGKGLNFKYYETGELSGLPDFNSLDAVKSGIIENVMIEGIKQKEDHFAITYTGYMLINEDDAYTFSISSDDGSRLYIDDQLVADNDGSHSVSTVKGSIGLLKGYHKFHVEYFEDSSDEEVSVMVESPKVKNQKITAGMLFH